MYIVIVFLLLFFLSFLVKFQFISWDTAIISMSIIIGTSFCYLKIEEEMETLISTIKKLMETLQNNNGKDENDNERN